MMWAGFVGLLLGVVIGKSIYDEPGANDFRAGMIFGYMVAWVWARWHRRERQ